MASTVVGLFDDQEAARRALEGLRSIGFSSNEISVVAADQEGAFQRHRIDDSGSVAAEGAVTGLASGAVVGSLIGLLVGMGAILVPGGILVAGPIAGLMTGAAAGAATGGILGGLIGMGIPKEHADVYAEGIRRGGVLLVADATGREDDAVEVMEENGAVDIEERAEQYRREGFTSYEVAATPYTTEQAEVDRNVGNVPAENIGADMEGLDAGTEVPGAPPMGQTGITRGSMTDSYTGMSQAYGTGNLSVPSNLSGDPGRHNQGTVDQAGSVGMTDQDVAPVRGSGIDAGLDDHTLSNNREMLEEGDANSLAEPGGTMSDDLGPETEATRTMGGAFDTTKDVSVEIPTVPDTTWSPATPQADSDSTGVMGETVDEVAKTNFSTPGATDPVLTTSGTMGASAHEPLAGMAQQDIADRDSGSMRTEDFRDEYDRRFSNIGMTYEQALPAYEFGHQMSQDDRFLGKEWGTSEPAMREDWEARNPGTWIMYREIARAGWDRAMARNGDNRAQML